MSKSGSARKSRSTPFPGVVIEGRVDSISPASGSQFTLLPPDNATGNFTKVVQRIPVKITLDPGQSARGPAAPGHVGRRDDPHRHRPRGPDERGSPSTAAAAAAVPRLTPAAHCPRPFIGVAAVLLGAFLSSLNTRLTTFGLADIRGGLGLGFDEGSWLTTVFGAAQMVAAPSAAWLEHRRRHPPRFCCGRARSSR